MSRFFRASWLAPVWTILIIIALSVPGKSLPSVSILDFDKYIHAGLFFVLTILWLAALADRTALRAIVIVSLIILFSFASELYQEMLPFDRTADIFDAIADSVGALVGFAFWGIRTAVTRPPVSPVDN